MPEIGFELEPIVPQMREETVTKKKPNTRIKIAEIQSTSILGIKIKATSNNRMPPIVTEIGKSLSVRAVLLVAPPPVKSFKPDLNASIIVGNERTKLMMPPAATAPAAI